MKSLSSPPPLRNIAAALETQLRKLFDRGAQDGFDVAAVLLHGSFLDQDKWSGGSHPPDIDLLVIQPELTRERLVSIYQGLGALDLPGGPIKLDSRVGPLDVTEGRPDAIIVQVAVCSSYDDISPATLQILAYHAKAIIGSPPDTNRLHRYDVATLQKWLERDLVDIAAIAVDNAIPYWAPSDDPTPRRVRALHAPRTANEQVKARRHARAKLHSWSLLTLSCGIEQLCGMRPDQMIALAGTVEDRHAFETMLAGFQARPSGN